MSEDALRKALEQHKSNLNEIELQIAQHGVTEAPIALINAARAERAAIEEIEERLDFAKNEAREEARKPRSSRGRRVVTSRAQQDDMSEIGDKLDAIRDKLHQLDVRLTRLETDVENLRRILTRNGHPVDPLPKWVLVAGGIVTIATLVLLVLLSVRVW